MQRWTWVADPPPLILQIWFLGENANYAAAEYAWQSATPPGAALMMLEAERMVAAAGIRNPTMAAALARLQRCVLVGTWEVHPQPSTLNPQPSTLSPEP